jgi:hypothetical protein
MIGSCHDKEFLKKSLTILGPIEKYLMSIFTCRSDCRRGSIVRCAQSEAAQNLYYLLRKISIIYCAKSLLFTAQNLCLPPRCGCPRCVDPTEFGTNTSGLPCGSCQGLLLPQVKTIKKGRLRERESTVLVRGLNASLECRHQSNII